MSADVSLSTMYIPSQLEVLQLPGFSADHVELIVMTAWYGLHRIVCYTHGDAA